MKSRTLGAIGTALAVIVLVLILAGSGAGALAVGLLAIVAAFAAARQAKGERDAQG
jgi:hypothetical protein